jgi:hypothetical protein
MNLQDLLKLLAQTLDSDEDSAAELASKIDHVQTYREAQVYTRDEGLVVTMTDGTEYQITVVRSK